MRLFFYIAFIFFLFCLSVPCSADCERQITVQEVYHRSNPNIFRKVLEPFKKGDTKKVFVDCELYKKIDVGDELADKDTDVTAIRLFSSEKDGGVIERKRYKVIRK